jgi:hypothetical protein
MSNARLMTGAGLWGAHGLGMVWASTVRQCTFIMHESRVAHALSTHSPCINNALIMCLGMTPPPHNLRYGGS